MELLGAPAGGAVALIAGAYLLGAIPTAYLAVRWKSGVDLRTYGSGNVGGANAIRAAGRGPGIAVIIFDTFVKGPLPVLLASSVVLDYGKGMEAAAGLAAVVGHNWPVFLRFHGGRGLGTGSGALLTMAWQMWAVFIAIGLVFWLATRNSPVGWALALAAIPVIAAVTGFAGEYVAYAALFAAVTAIKRLASNQGIRRPNRETSKVRLLWYRLVYDRDVRDRDAWVRGDTGT